MNETPRIRLYVEAPLAAGATVPADAGQVHYLKNVMRRGAGDNVLLFNGLDGEWRAEIAELGRRNGQYKVAEQTREQSDDGAGPWLLFAPVKRKETDLIIEKATELGASVIWPVITRHTNSERVRIDRLQTIAREAAEQCGRLGLPELKQPAPLMDALADWPTDSPGNSPGNSPGGRRLLVMDETGGGRPLVELAAQIAQEKGGDAAILIGPEGGFAEVELDALANLPFVIRAGLGGADTPRRNGCHRRPCLLAGDCR